MKNIRCISGIVVFLLVSAQFTVFADSKQRTEIDKFLKSYEEVVVSAEKAAKSNKITDLIKVQGNAVKMSEQADKIQSYDEWTTGDSVKYLELSDRYTKAMSAMSNSMNTGSFGF
jgi:hypothetical protein